MNWSNLYDKYDYIVNTQAHRQGGGGGGAMGSSASPHAPQSSP